MSEKLEGIDLNAALKAYENGDDAAFDPIFNAMRAPLCFFINRYVNDPSAAEDIMMDTFAELLLNGRRFNYKSSLSSYLFSIARNKAVTYFRSQQKLQPLKDDNIPDPDYSVIEEEYLSSEERRRLHEAMADLREEYRTVLHLHYFEDMSIERIAVVMKKNKKQVYNLLHRARASLKEVLGDLL
jgi:RNA polymerase sigma-70 factor (ECF subfamily)